MAHAPRRRRRDLPERVCSIDIELEPGKYYHIDSDGDIDCRHIDRPPFLGLRPAPVAPLPPPPPALPAPVPDGFGRVLHISGLSLRYPDSFKLKEIDPHRFALRQAHIEVIVEISRAAESFESFVAQSQDMKRRFEPDRFKPPEYVILGGQRCLVTYNRRMEGRWYWRWMTIRNGMTYALQFSMPVERIGGDNLGWRILETVTF